MLKVKLVHPSAKLPSRATEGAAGYDLYASVPAVVPAGGWTLVSTGISISIPSGTYGRVAPRSGLSMKGICVGAGVVDEDFRGQVGVLLYNHANTDFEVKEGDRVAQLVLEKIETPDVVQVDELESTIRGSGGFGSTGQ
jgi:dUTP pyrophosphatase